MYNQICQVCNQKPATERHHLFSQGTKKGWRYKLYGDLIHHESNLICVCYDCHHNKPIPKQSEKQFCMNLSIDVRSKKNNIFDKSMV